MADLNVPSAATPWMHIGMALLGEAERAGSVHNPRIVEMFRVAGTPQFETDETAWCAADAGSLLRLSGWEGTKSALASSYATFGADLGGRPQYGCIVVFHPLAPGASGHVGFFVRDLGDGRIEVLSGNHGNKHDIAPFAKSKVRCYRWPTARLAQLPASDILPNILTLAPQDAPSWIRAPNAERPPAQVITVPAADNFARVHPWIAKWEGEKYTNHPRDKGGPTKYGITLARLSDVRGREVSASEVENLTREEAAQILKRFYWDPLQCDRMPIALAAMTYNAGVNSGPVRGAKFLQRALNNQGAGLDVDGDIGPLTLTAANTCPDIARAVRDYAEIYEAYYRALDDFDVFGNGWLNRLNDITPRALAVAGERLPTTGDKPVEPTIQMPATTGQSLEQRVGLLEQRSSTWEGRLRSLEVFSGIPTGGKPADTAPSPAPVVTPPPANPATSDDSARTDMRTAVVGAGGTLLAWLGGLLTDPTAAALGTSIVTGAAGGLPSLALNVLRGFLSSRYGAPKQ